MGGLPTERPLQVINQSIRIGFPSKKRLSFFVVFAVFVSNNSHEDGKDHKEKSRID